jgi:nucleoid DNA-binding protein
MKKADLINYIAQRSSLTKKDSAAALEATLTAITCALSNGEPVTLVGFGTFAVSERAARDGINPATKATIKIPASKAVKFKAGKALKDGVN